MSPLSVKSVITRKHELESLERVLSQWSWVSLGGGKVTETKKCFTYFQLCKYNICLKCFWLRKRRVLYVLFHSLCPVDMTTWLSYIENKNYSIPKTSREKILWISMSNPRERWNDICQIITTWWSATWLHWCAGIIHPSMMISALVSVVECQAPATVTSCTASDQSLLLSPVFTRAVIVKVRDNLVRMVTNVRDIVSGLLSSHLCCHHQPSIPAGDHFSWFCRHTALRVRGVLTRTCS